MGNCKNIKLTVGNYKMKIESLQSDNVTVDELLNEYAIDENTVVSGDGAEEVIIKLSDGTQFSLYVSRTKVAEDLNGNAIFQAAHNAFYGTTVNYAGLLLLAQNMVRMKTVPGIVDLTAYPPGTFTWVDTTFRVPFGYRGVKLGGAASMAAIAVPVMKEEHTFFVISSDGAGLDIVAEDSGSSDLDILVPTTNDHSGRNKDFFIFFYDTVASRWRVKLNDYTA